jgi:hypothetical protein
MLNERKAPRGKTHDERKLEIWPFSSRRQIPHHIRDDTPLLQLAQGENKMTVAPPSLLGRQIDVPQPPLMLLQRPNNV